MEIKTGDVVAVMGDKDGNHTYLRHAGRGGIWTGVVEEIEGDRALVGGSWRPLDHYTVMLCGSSRAQQAIK